jgi:hypothetical protein
VYFLEESKDFHLFYSDDNDLLRTFNKYFDFLWEHKTLSAPNVKPHVDYDKEPDERVLDVNVVDKKGLWFTISYRELPGKLELDSFALVHIDSSDFDLKIYGVVLVNDTNRIHEIITEKKEVFTSANRIYYEYKMRPSSQNKDEAFCQYRFNISEDLFGDGEKHDTMRGFYVENPTGKYRKIFGIRLSSETILETQLRSNVREYSKDDQLTSAVKNVVERREGKLLK